MDVINGWIDIYNEKFDALMATAYPGLSHFPAMNEHRIPLASSLLYLFIVYYFGPKYLEGRKPVNWKWGIVAYNFALVGLNAYLVHEFVASGWNGRYSLGCQDASHSTVGPEYRMAKATYIYFLSKHLEFFDTYLFMLKQKWTNVSTLHVVHHSSMAYATWFVAKFGPNGYGTFGAFLNSFIHVLMYSYYGLAAIGPQMRPYLWWKKYLTKLQMFQFCAVMIHMGNVMCNYPGCKYPFFLNVLQIFMCCLFLVMFAQFYIKAYTKTQTTTTSVPTTKKLKPS